MIARVILNDWLLQRAEGHYLDAEWELAEVAAREHTTEEVNPGTADNGQQAPCALEEVDQKHARVQLYLRYRTAAERSFYRAYYALRGLRKDKVREELEVEKFREEIKRAVRQEATIAAAERERQNAEAEVLAARKAEELAAGQREKALQQKRKKNGGAPVVVEQWVEVDMEDGRAVTKLYPSNEEVKQAAEAKDADLVYRRINFPYGIPAEYGWVAAPDDVETRERGGAGIQRMTLETWLRSTAREQANGTGHVGPRESGICPGRWSAGDANARCAHITVRCWRGRRGRG